MARLLTQRTGPTLDEASVVVVYGAGTLGSRLVSALLVMGRPPAAVVDRSESMWGSDVFGIPVIPLDRASSVAGSGFTAIVGVWNPHGHRFAATAVALKRAGAGRVLPFHVAARGLPDVLPHYCHDRPERFEDAASRIAAAYRLLDDDESRLTFEREIAWRLGDVSVADRTPVSDQYLVGLYQPKASEIIVDCGAFDGDTLRAFLDAPRAFARYWAYEPDPANFIRLLNTVASLPADVAERIEIRQAASFDRRTELRFSPGGDGGRLSENGGRVPDSGVTAGP